MKGISGTLVSVPRKGLQFLFSGNEYFDRLIQLIGNSKSTIHLQTYIFDTDATGKLILDHLFLAANRGVKVYLVVDAYASSKLAKEIPNHPNLLFRSFSPVITSKRIQIGRRLHHKIFVSDASYALVGGLNIADKYHYGNLENPPWLDFAIEVVKTPALRLHEYCAQIWEKDFRIILTSEYINQNRIRNTNLISLKINRNDWFRNKIEIYKSYRNAIKYAKSDILIINSYFLPGLRMRRLIHQASLRGVKVRVVLAKYSDIKLVQYAIRYLYNWMLRNRIEIVLWKPSVMHGKLMIVDHKLLMIGSYNFNALSDYASLELNITVEDQQFSKDVIQKINAKLAGNTETISPLEFQKKYLLILQVFDWFNYQIIRMMLRITFWFTPGKPIR